MILSSAAYIVVFGYGILMVIMSPMIFDSGATSKAWSAFFVFLFFPVLVLLSVTFSWCAFGFRRYTTIPLSLALPVVYGVIFWFSAF